MEDFKTIYDTLPKKIQSILDKPFHEWTIEESRDVCQTFKVEIPIANTNETWFVCPGEKCPFFDIDEGSPYYNCFLFSCMSIEGWGDAVIENIVENIIKKVSADKL